MFDKTAESETKRDGGAKKTTTQKDKTKTNKQDKNEGFYRSQKEVDSAFKKRFSTEKERWNNEQEAKKQAEKDNGKTQALLKTIAEQTENFNQIYPEVDVLFKIRHNPLFTYLLLSGKSLLDTYEFLYADTAKARLRNELEQEIIGNMKARNTRPRVIDAANSGGSLKDIARLSDAEILRIDQRIKNGERVTI